MFEEVRYHVEGETYESLYAKQQEAESYLKELKTNPEQVKSICGWEWLRRFLESLSACLGGRINDLRYCHSKLV